VINLLADNKSVQEEAKEKTGELTSGFLGTFTKCKLSILSALQKGIN
jgi:hypothetical protein